MYLRELRINGFKSFADRTRLTLEPGVTAIVGPNGCGKSNIADAIRWVLGEQSAKSLRAGAMQDVIFQGTDSRKPVQLCEVFLTFTDCEAELGTSFNEIEIGRRVVRDGSSDYFLNGKACRLKDIQRLFMDTGVGRVSYSFLVQGQIDQILSTNPAERRIIFEEAAGISKYKAQRREALGKLDLVDTNLARVTDVLNEKTRQMASLKRQAGKAVRWRRLKNRLTHLDLAHGRHRWDGLAGVVVTLEAELAKLNGELQSARRELAGREEILAGQKARRGEIFQRLQEAQQAVYDARSEKESAESQADFAKVRATDALDRRTRLDQEVASLSGRLEELALRVGEEARTQKEAQMGVGTSDAAFQERARELENLQNRLVAAEQEWSKRRQALLMTESTITRQRQDSTHLEIELKSMEARATGLQEDAARQADEVGRLREHLAGFVEDLNARQVARAEADAEVQRRRDALAALQQKFREVQGRVTEADRALAQLNAQVRILDGLQQKLEGFSEAAKALVQGKLGDAAPGGPPALLLPQLRVEEESARALEALLGPATDAVVVADPAAAGAILEALEGRKLGRAVLAWKAAGDGGAGEVVPPAGLVLAASLVRPEDPSLAEAISAWLAGCFVAEDRSSALAASSLAGFHFRLIATRQGDVLDARGWVMGGGASARAGDGFLKRQAELRKLRTQAKAAEETLTARRRESTDLHEQMGDAERALEEARKHAADSATELASLAGQERAAQESLRQAEARSARAQQDLQQFETRKTESARRLQAAREALRTAEEQLEDQRRLVTDGEASVVRAREDRDAHRDSLAEVRLELAEKRQKLELLARGLSELERQQRDVTDQIGRRREEMARLAEEAARLTEDSGNQAARAKQLERQLAALMESLEAYRKAMAAEEQGITALEAEVAKFRTAAGRLGEESRQRELKLTRDRAELEHLVGEIQREYETDLSKVSWKLQLWAAGDAPLARIRVDIDEDSPEEIEDEPERPAPEAEDLKALDNTDWNAIGEEIRQLRGRLAAMGPVNVSAIDEYRELKDSHAFTQAQADDLTASKTELLAAIDEINRTSQDLFRQTFEQIRRNFQYTFDQLFGGGHADLELQESEDVLESGIDIIARPPGTKLRTLALLSGGQKTMTAVGLLFAIYMVKPSPFCVLDELDAPLDDANVGRFTAMLKRFLEYSQFLIITHNKRTIAAADGIYGVTMQEKGVSRMVSLRFNHDTGQTESLPEAEAIGSGI